nr:TetR family transcriptional regulator [Kibdelosporangium sp. MJ126-NF4]CEL14523.1 Transcriptional regulator, TetR family [Kibdelosporangium sp. MJ126-NF4]CTQ88888.1 Transcriptional regulator, TetR family [Kibdelosporangium sp. MJ126-NF4]
MTEPGLRERKKQQTRRRIIDVAIGLFGERGFENVPVAQIAKQAEVSEATVFNYFPSKEDLVYQDMEEYEITLLSAVRARADGVTVVGAFRDFLLRPRGALADESIDVIAKVARIIADSPTLQARELRAFDRYTSELAGLISRESRARTQRMEPWVIANALMGVHRAMKDHVHRQALAGKDGARIVREVMAQARSAFETLEKGLA